MRVELLYWKLEGSKAKEVKAFVQLGNGMRFAMRKGAKMTPPDCFPIERAWRAGRTKEKMDLANIRFFPIEEDVDLVHKVHLACKTQTLKATMWWYDRVKEEAEKKILADIQDMCEHGV